MITIGWQRDRDRISGILSVDTENHFDNRVRGGDSRMKYDDGDVSFRVNTWTRLP